MSHVMCELTHMLLCVYICEYILNVPVVFLFRSDEYLLNVLYVTVIIVQILILLSLTLVRPRHLYLAAEDERDSSPMS